MKANKTQPTDNPVDKFLETLENPQRKSDSLKLIEMMRKATGESPVMWGTSIIGFGTTHYKYESGHEGDTMTIGFAPRRAALVIYGVIFYDQFNDQNVKLLPKLGEHTTGKGCLYIKDLSKIDTRVLSKMLTQAYQQKTHE